MTDTLFNTENEIAVLSILLNNPTRVFEIDKIKPFMMSSTPNQILLDTMLELSKDSLVPDEQLILGVLGAKSKLATVGDTDYLSYLKNQTYDANNLKQYEKLVVDNYKAKTLISLSAKLNGMVSVSTSPDEIINYARSSLDTLTAAVGGDVTSDFLSVLKDGWEEITRRVENPGTVGISTGIKDLNLNTGGVAKGKLWLIAGRPSMGKSAVICNMIMSNGEQRIPSLVFSYEMTKFDLTERFLGIKTQIPISDIHLGLLDKTNLTKIRDTIADIKDYPIFVDTNFSGGLGYVTSTIRKYKKIKDVQLVFLDYVQLMAERNTNSTNELGQISRELKLLANELEIGIILLSQLNRGVELREDKRPTLADLRQSGNLEEDADLVMMLYRDEYYVKDSKYAGTLECVLRKNRQTGILGSMLLNFDKETNRISSR